MTGTLISIGVSDTLLAKNNLIAQNLAVEVVEAVKSVQKANILNKPDAPLCWLTIDPDIPAAQCAQPQNQVQNDTNYRLLQKDNGNWQLQTADGNEDLDLENDAADPKQYRLYLDTNLDYRPYIALATASSNPSLGEEPTGFYRSIYFSDLVAGESVKLEVTVQWFEGAKVRTLEIFTILANHSE